MMYSETPEQLNEVYRTERAAVIARLNKLMGNAVVPLEQVAPLLPDNPEWTAGVPRQKGVRRAKTIAHRPPS